MNTKPVRTHMAECGPKYLGVENNKRIVDALEDLIDNQGYEQMWQMQMCDAAIVGQAIGEAGLGDEYFRWCEAVLFSESTTHTCFPTGASPAADGRAKAERSSAAERLPEPRVTPLDIALYNVPEVLYSSANPDLWSNLSDQFNLFGKLVPHEVNAGLPPACLPACLPAFLPSSLFPT